jgi:hypothetical protein
MNKREAIQAMISGDKVKLEKMSGEFIYYCTVDGYFKYQDGSQSNLTLGKDGKWEIYKEPKQKVKMWQFVVVDGKDVAMTELFYRDAEAAERVTGCGVVFKADWTEIEVEVEE